LNYQPGVRLFSISEVYLLHFVQANLWVEENPLQTQEYLGREHGRVAGKELFRYIPNARKKHTCPYQKFHPHGIC
jgi:hypothetical protein